MEYLEIITLQPSDWKDYKELRLRALKEEPQAFASTYDENIKLPDEFWQMRLEEALAGESQWLLFARQQDNLVGMAGAFVKDEKDTVHIIAVFVDKKYRGQGISKKLMNNLISAIKQNNEIRRLLVGVNPEQVAALNLYQNIGFKLIKKGKIILGDGKEHENYEMEMLVER